MPQHHTLLRPGLRRRHPLRWTTRGGRDARQHRLWHRGIRYIHALHRLDFRCSVQAVVGSVAAAVGRRSDRIVFDRAGVHDRRRLGSMVGDDLSERGDRLPSLRWQTTRDRHTAYAALYAGLPADRYRACSGPSWGRAGFHGALANLTGNSSAPLF